MYTVHIEFVKIEMNLSSTKLKGIFDENFGGFSVSCNLARRN